MRKTQVRLHVEQPLGEGQAVRVEGTQAHYLFNVMRLGPGDRLALFNGRDGEFEATVATAGKRRGDLHCGARLREMEMPPDLWLLFAPIKKTRTDFIVEKAVELGVRRIIPVRSTHTNAERFRAERQQARAIEAAEQCGALYVPQVDALRPLEQLLEGWDQSRRILFADENRAGHPFALAGAATGADPGPWAVLIGPEGGFGEAERTRLQGMAAVVPISLGPRILRAETAAVAALSLWQATLGDWQ